MFDREEFRDEIAAQLKDVPRDKCVAFAVRSAMRVLPLLAVREKTSTVFIMPGTSSRDAFLFWKEKNRNRHLLEILRAYSRSIGVVLTGKYAVYATYADVATAAAEAADDNATCAAAAANATNAAAAYATNTYAAYAYASDTYTDAYAAANAAVIAADANADAFMLQVIRQDLAALQKITATELLQQSLWATTLSYDWQQWLVDFKADALSLNAGFGVWLDWYEDRLQGKPIDVELLTKWNAIPAELEQQGAAAINAYLKNLVQKTVLQPLNRVRAIFIGYGESGKTSLIRALHGEPVTEGKEAMTVDIDIREWSVPDSNIKAHFWDFGGQVMAHATHQFFLRSSCLYVLVLNARSEIGGTEQSEYWLEHVKGFGKNAPVMIVGNKADLAGINLDMGYLKSKYANIVDFYPVSCTQATSNYKAKFDSFKQDFCQQLREVATNQMLFTKEQFGVLEALRHYSPKAAFLSHQKFIEICAGHGVGTEGVQNRDWLLDILDKLGVVIHFPQLACLDDYVLNPRWLTHGVYTLMYKQQARLTLRDAVAILRDKPISDELGNVLDYPMDKCRFIMDAMQEFKLCFPLPYDRNTLIIPELLPTDQPRNIPFEQFKQGTLAFEFVFRGFLPRHVMPELIVNHHEEIVNNIVWQRGVVLKNKIYNSQALLQVDYHERVLSIWVRGGDARDYLSLLNNEVLKILGRLELDYKEWIALPLTACISDNTLIRNQEKAPYRQILAFARKGEKNYISESGLEYDLGKVLGVILSKEGRVKEGIINNFYGSHATVNQESEVDVTTINQNVSNSTVHGSVVAAEKIENSFNSLKESKADDAVKALLEQLLTEIRALNTKVPAAQAQAVENMAKRADTLVTESKSEKPDTEWYQLSFKGIKEAALAIGDAAKPVLDIAEKLSPLLLGL